MLPSMKRLPLATPFCELVPFDSLEVRSSFYSRSCDGEAALSGA